MKEYLVSSLWCSASRYVVASVAVGAVHRMGWWPQLGTVTDTVTVIRAMAQGSGMLNWLMEVCNEGRRKTLIRMVLRDDLSQLVSILRIMGARFLTDREWSDTEKNGAILAL